MTRYVFVSHANLDKPALKAILEKLLAAGLPLWIDRPEEVGLTANRWLLPGIRPGADWDEEIRHAYQGAACVLFFLSRNSNNPARSDSLFREFDYGSVNNRLVIAKIDDIGRDEMSGLMRIRQAVDLSRFHGNPSNELERLITVLRSFVLGEGARPTSDAGRIHMNPIVGAIVAAIPALAVDTTNTAVKDAYLTLKTIILQKCGEHEKIRQSLTSLEKDHESLYSQQDLHKEIQDLGLNSDEDVLAAFKILSTTLQRPEVRQTVHAKFEQSGGNFKGVGVIAKNEGNITIG
jgi:hypothetical protein